MREHFPVLESCLYFNTAYTAPLSSSLLTWRAADDVTYLEQGDSYKTITEKKYFDEAQTVLAQFAGAEKATTFIAANFSSAFQNFLLHLPRDFRFLVLEDEYPSLTGIVDDLGFFAKKLPVSTTVENTVWEELQNNSYAVLTLSAIQYTSGLYFDFASLSRIKKAFPSLIILIDGTQFLGAEIFSLRESPVDAIFGSSYKWLLAGYGTGYAILKPSLLSHLNISQEKLAATYDRGQLSVKSVGSLSFSLKQIMAADFPKLIQYKKQLSKRMFEELKNRGLLSEEIAQRFAHSSIYNLQINDSVYRGLLEKNVRCIKRGEGVRVAIHHYNTQEDITTFFKIIDALL